ncbi:MAG: hypothetical protein JSU85_10620 [Candidatus Zixiibacteriota bacterium]|nr:MAG: hypothetical protein JSU85_10620 [candidate division Zixibacteria bacterium]
MKFKLALVFSLFAMLGVLTGCSSDPVMPEEPDTATGTTDGTGISTVSAGPYSIEVSVVNTSLSPVSGASVACYLMHEHLLTIASLPNGSYYPGLVMTSLEDAQSRRSVGGGAGPEIVGAAKAARETEISVEIIVHNASIASHGYDSEPQNYSLIQSDSWTIENTQTLDMESFYQFMDTVDFQGSVFVHLNSDISLAAGAGRQLASFLLGHINSFEAFASLMSWELRLFSGDTVTVTTMTYMEGKLPLMNISGLSMYRDFWMQFTLTWGENPWDLDSHLFTPEIPGDSDTLAYHVYYGSPGNASEPPYADLDVDDVTSYGPEHITIWDEFPGTYIYAVYHYSGSGTITTSEADVGVLKPDGTVELFSVPDDITAGDNYWWHVCNIDGTTGVIAVVDTIASATPGWGYYSIPPGANQVMPPKNRQ